MRRSISRLLRSTQSSAGVERDARWYDSSYADSSEYVQPYYGSRYYPVWAVIVERARQAKAQHILDVGCGSGQLAAYLIEGLGLPSYTGVDFSRKAIEIARRVVPGGNFTVGDALDHRTYEREFDLIICTEVLEHIEEDLKVVSLFPSGSRCLCTVPDFPYPSHVRHFTSAEQVAERYGSAFELFDVVEFKAVGHKKTPVLRYFLIDGVRA